MRSLPAVPEEIRSGAASLGLEVDAGSGEGPVVLSFDRRTGAQGLHINDVITAIDGKPVRDMSELVRVLSGYKPGDEVEVSYRRYKLTGTAKIVLVKKK
ncbi:MAG: PDZ domain-containing protein [Tepidisphaera sp.]|nr:PDZ domain-containing protein [Tepidisphaera sp.]